MSSRKTNSSTSRWEDSDWRNQQAGEYVLGTLEGAELSRFVDRLAYDETLELLVANWEERLQPLADATSPVEPPTRVWKRIANSLYSNRDRQLAQLSDRFRQARAKTLEQERELSFWRSAGRIAGVACLCLSFIVWIQQSVKKPVFDAISIVSSDDGPLWIIDASTDSSTIKITAIAPPNITSSEAHQLWMIKPAGDGVISLGLLPQGGKTSITISNTAINRDVVTLAVSLEPAGGSPEPAPTGPVLYQGDFSIIQTTFGE